MAVESSDLVDLVMGHPLAPATPFSLDISKCECNHMVMQDNMRPLRVVIVGGGAAGASAAARLRRLDERAEITILEKSPDVSVAACGMPYFIGGEIADRSRMALHRPDSLGALLNVNVLADTEAVAIDRGRKTVLARHGGDGSEREIPYDKLVLATGAVPLRPELPNTHDDRVRVLRTLADMDGIRQATRDARRVVVVGAGFIGLAMAEQLKQGGRTVSVVEMTPQVLPPLDPDMAAAVQAALGQAGVEVFVGDAVTAFEPDGDVLMCRLRSGNVLPADLVVLAVGVGPDTALAAAAGLDVAARGHIVVNEWQQTSDPDIYAAGDAVELFDRQTAARMTLPMGGPANRQGRSIADHIGLPGQARPYPGHLGTAIVRVFGMTAAITGLSEKALQAAGTAYCRTVVTDFNHASYYPGATPITLKLLWHRIDGRVLGAQACGADGVDKRIDVIATAIAGKLTIDDLADLELCYAPPFGSARDVVNTAGFAAQNARRGLVKTVTAVPPDATLVDVRPQEMAALSPIPGSVNIPLPQLRKRLGELSMDRPVVTVCAMGKTSYFAARILAQHGFADVTSFAGGVRFLSPASGSPSQAPVAPAPPAAGAAQAATSCPPVACGTPAPAALVIDACGMACPGPLLKVRDAVGRLGYGQLLVVTASDPGFPRDIQAFAEATGLTLESCTTEKGVITARIRKTGSAQAGAAGPAAGRRKGAAIVVFSGDWDKVMASLVIANGAAAMGGAVTMFFTFWGLNALRKEQRVAVPGKTFLDRLFGRMMPRGLRKLGLSRMNMAGIGNPMMTWRMKQLNLPNPHGLLASAQAAGVRIVACSMAMEAMGLRREELLENVEIGGVADFLGAAEESGTQLFI